MDTCHNDKSANVPSLHVKQRKKSSRSPMIPSAFHTLVKPTGAICNLDCEYCFYLEKESLYPKSNFRMPDDLLEIYIRQLMEAKLVDFVRNL